MNHAETLLRSPAFLEKICAHAREGASPHVAAQVEGMEEEDYWQLWDEGKQAKTKEDPTERDEFLLRFVREIKLALAKARMDAEKRVFQKNPSAYLRYGSGREGGAEARGWESGIAREKSLFASNPLAYLLRGAGKSPPDGHIQWNKNRSGKWTPTFTPDDETPTAEFFRKYSRENAQPGEREARSAEDLAKAREWVREFFGEEVSLPSPASEPQPPSHKQGGGLSSPSPFTERGTGGEVGSKGPGP